MAIDSGIVNKEIRAQVIPLLKRAGFTYFRSRTSWRNRTNRIDVINFQSFNSYLASSLRCTTYSFAVNLGCYLNYIPPHFGRAIASKAGTPVPREYECHLRKPLLKSISQPEFPRTNIWYIDPAGKYVGPAVSDAKSVISNIAFEWFERFADDGEVLRTFLNDSEKNNDTNGFGANPSPIRSYLIGYTAIFLKRNGLAIKHLQTALDSGCFNDAEQAIQDCLAQARDQK
ncbi:MAG TPA: DUF4304 domain-containing protein [Candidatus Acidoferrum sp.]|nr:DUF4304 domain-containing protein [Candidatus Acidoferrum sp.]